jgi:hypothetical protein
MTAISLNWGWVGVMAFYGLWVSLFLLAVSSGAYLARAIFYARNMSDISRPDVRLAQSHVELARYISGMNAEQRQHHIQIVNALQLPLTFLPGQSLVTNEGIEIPYEALLRYVSGMREIQREGGETLYRMPAERNASAEDRGAFRAIADDIVEKSYAISQPRGNKPVITNKDGIIRYVETLFNQNLVKT